MNAADRHPIEIKLSISASGMIGILMLALSCVAGSAKAQEDSTSLEAIVKADLSTSWQHAGTFFTAPLHFNQTDWFITGSILGGTALLFTADPSVRTFAQRNRSDGGDNVSNVIQGYGQPVYGVGVAAGLYIGGCALKNSGMRTTAVMILESMAFAGITTTVIKTLAGRSRPYLEEGQYRFSGMQFNTDHTSLPSGHSTVAFSISSVLAERLHNVYASVGLYSLAAAVMGARIYNDEHWLSDTFLGAAIGTASGIAVAHYHEKSTDEVSVSIIPMGDRIGIYVVF